MTADSYAVSVADAPVPTYATTGRHGFKRSFALIIIGLPLLVYYLWICATFYRGALVVPSSVQELVDVVSRVPGPTWMAVMICAGWFLLQALLQIYAPGKSQEGTPLSDGARLKYKMNGWFSWWFTVGLAIVVVWLDWVPATLLYDEFGPILTTFNIVTFAFAGYLYFHGRTRERDLSIGKPLYDYFMGTSLNPRIGGFDLKLFCEARPGLMLWILINASCAAKQYELHGTVTVAMVLVNAFHFLYVADYFFHEPAILTTMDIKHEKFGWMLCWGDLVWVPFTYSLQALYLVQHPHELPVWGTVVIIALNMAGYYIFRAVNIQKHRFRMHPERLIWGRKPEYIRTEQGALLLTSGWWGMARHLNYLGDLMMGLAWCLPCLFEHVLPYFYIIYFTILLIHRERRDSEMCRIKYGRDWTAYCRRVPWRIVPGIYRIAGRAEPAFAAAGSR